MPKIIENLREQLLVEAKRQIAERGYAETTVRSVARAVGVGVGTVYNYFESKEMLVASFVFDAWKKYLEKMAHLPKENARELVFGVYAALTDFAQENAALFSDSEVARASSSGFSSRHKMLRAQISGFVSPVCPDGFTADFVSESLICWASEGVDFDVLYPTLEKIIKK